MPLAARSRHFHPVLRSGAGIGNNSPASSASIVSAATAPKLSIAIAPDADGVRASILRDYDLIVSSESGPAKGVIAASDARHVCYCHTPMRYLWDLYPTIATSGPQPLKARSYSTPLGIYLRLWDFASAARVDDFVANSENVRRRIWKTYRRESQVVQPPVSIESFYWRPDENYYLMVSELVPYKPAGRRGARL